MRLVGDIFPLEYRPEYQCREQRRLCVHLALYGREPKGVGECVSHGADECRCHDYGRLYGSGGIVSVGRAYEAASQMGYSPEQERYCERAGYGGSGVDEHRHMSRVRRKYREDTVYHHEKRSSGGMSYLHLIRCGDELGTVPETCRWLQRKHIGKQRKGEDHPTPYYALFLK